MDLHAKLADLGLTLPPAPKPVAAYVPAVLSGRTVFVSGQLPIRDGDLLATGPVPSSATIEQARAAAAQCALNALAVVDHLIASDWSRFQRILRVGVFVASDAQFRDQSKVANGASELLVELFGESGRHARVAVGVNVLPLGAAVEAEFTLEIHR